MRAAPIFCQPNFWDNFDKNINFNANLIEDDMVRRNWQNVKGISGKFERQH